MNKMSVLVDIDPISLLLGLGVISCIIAFGVYLIARVFKRTR